MIIKSKAPLRIGLAGGGTDVSPYCDEFGGCVLNACINMYAYAVIEPRDDGKIEFRCEDRFEYATIDSDEHLEINGRFDLLKGVYNRVVKDFTKHPLGFTLTTYVDTPAGTGLGSSSTLAVAVLKAFQEWQNLPLGEYDIARMAYCIEREDLKMAGGKQDQYAASFGGFNFMEFKGSRVLVNPLRVKKEYVNELEYNILLYYMGTSRMSSEIIEAQSKNVKEKNPNAIEGMHMLKKYAYEMKEAVLTGRLDRMGEILSMGWENKKKTSSVISNPKIDEIYNTALKAGATGGKISGAGGGGMFMFYCPNTARYRVINELSKLGGEFRRFRFTNIGAESWKI